MPQRERERENMKKVWKKVDDDPIKDDRAKEKIGGNIE